MGNLNLMAAYIVTVEIANATTQATFATEIRKKYPAVCPLTKHAWVILSEDTTVSIRDYLTTFVNASSDRLFVLKCSAPGSWRNSYGKDHDEWLKKYL